ncbi:MAG: hypothetical protein JXB32_23250 [Deltaproteobacteria bacterium]|nr:hypothetical protein [Deltaproteobacteria bacterium]
MTRWTWMGVTAALAVVAGCTESNPHYVEPDAEDDGGDTAGDVPPADADADVPDDVEAETGADADVDVEPDGDADVEAEADVPPPCTEGETRCAGDDLETCQADGTWLAAPCDDGCADGPPAHCGTWAPSNIAPALFDAGDGTLGPDGAWPSNDERVTINTETGEISAGWMDGVRDAGDGLDEDTGIYFEVVPQGEGLPDLGVFAMESAVIPDDTTITVTGGNAFVLVVDGELRVGGRFDCGARTSGWYDTPVAGPGAYDGAAGPGVGADGIEDTTDVMLDGGGGGGSFGGAGGAGGYGAIGGAAGTAYGTPELVPLLGGSSGGDGADEPGEGGTGGGACAFLSRTAIVVEATGTLGAPGLGGRGADASGGGGGGGSGGGLLLEAPSVTVAGTLAVNGGGGGAGAESQYRDGDNGERGRFDTTAAAGGAGTGAGCSGGEGSALAETGGPSVCDGDDDDGGGGGGGGGRIRLNARTLDTSAGTFAPDLGTAACTTGGLPVS